MLNSLAYDKIEKNKVNLENEINRNKSEFQQIKEMYQEVHNNSYQRLTFLGLLIRKVWDNGVKDG